MFNLRIIGAVCAALFLAACSGGGGGGGGGGSASKQAASTSTTYLALGPQIIIKRLISYYTDGSQSTTDVTGFSQGSLAVDTIDHVTVTGNFDLIPAGKETLVGAIVEPSISTAPILAKENYPSDWTTTGAVTKPSVSQAKGKYLDDAAYVADGSVTAPFRQATLTPNGPADKATAINDPNAYVKAPKTGVYDLHWGTPDPMGPQYANNFNQGNSKYQLPTSTFIFRAWLSGGTGSCAIITSADSNCGATLSAPSSDIIDAWNKGWTGKGSNVLIWDSIGASPISSHPAIVQTIAYRYAMGAKFYGMSWTNAEPSIPLNTVLNLDGTATSTTTPISMHVINMSFGAKLNDYLGVQPTSGWTTDQLKDARTHFSGFSSDALILSNNSYQGAFNFLNAVLVRSAGNDHIDAQYEPANWYLAQNSITLGRLLIVGALDKVGSPTAQATIADYSNKAGIDPTIQSRFLVESGAIAYPNGNYYAGSPLSNSDVGTSFAAPRVSAYAAIVRQKFENLTAANTADILLATARYDTLTCYPNCDKAIYGQGEASLSRALAPVGYLR